MNQEKLRLRSTAEKKCLSPSSPSPIPVQAYQKLWFPYWSLEQVSWAGKSASARVWCSSSAGAKTSQMSNGFGKGDRSFVFLEPFTSQKQASKEYIHMLLVAILENTLWEISENCNTSNVSWIPLVLGDNSREIQLSHEISPWGKDNDFGISKSMRYHSNKQKKTKLLRLVWSSRQEQ